MNYRLFLYDCTGIFLKQLDNILSIECNRKANSIGFATITLPMTLDDFLKLEVDYRLEIYRYGRNGKTVLVGETCWFLTTWTYENVGNCDGVATLIFEDVIGLLNRRVVAYSEVTTFDYASYMKQRADNFLTLLVYYNLGDGVGNLTFANTEPNFNGLVSGTFGAVPAIASWQTAAYDGDISRREVPEIESNVMQNNSAITETRSFAGANLLETMQEVAESSLLQGEYLYFDIVYTPASSNTSATFAFRTWVGNRGINRSSTMIFGPDWKNVAEVSITRSYSRYANVAYVYGNGELDQRSVGSYIEPDVADDCPFWAREIASTANAGLGGAVHQTDDLVGAARLLLAENGVMETATAKILQVPGYLFFEDYNYGDVATFVIGRFVRTMRFDEFSLTVQNMQEEIDVPLTFS